MRRLVPSALCLLARSCAAVPLLQLQEVIAYPEVVTAMADIRPHLIGLFDHRGKPIPLLALDRVTKKNGFLENHFNA